MEGKELVKEAIDQATKLREVALDAAKRELVEMMTPKLKQMIEKKVRGQFGMGTKKEDVDRMRRGVQDNWPGESHTGFEESKDEGESSMEKDDVKDLDMEAALAEFFPQLAEMGDDDMDMSEMGAYGGDEDDMAKRESEIPTLGEEEVAEAKKDKDDDMEEAVELDETELARIYQEALQTEVQVSKGFKDMTKAGELDEVDPAAGLPDVKTKGAKPWEEEEPPAKQDYQVKEHAEKVREMIRAGLKENRALRAKLSKAVEMIETLGGKLHEVNLFNSKVLHANRILTKAGRLTKEQKVSMMEQLDKAENIREVKLTYNAIMESFKISGVMNESRTARKPKANAQKARTSGSPDQKVLSESVDRGSDPQKSRWQLLAGIVN